MGGETRVSLPSASKETEDQMLKSDELRGDGGNRRVVGKVTGVRARQPLTSTNDHPS